MFPLRFFSNLCVIDDLPKYTVIQYIYILLMLSSATVNNTQLDHDEYYNLFYTCVYSFEE